MTVVFVTVSVKTRIVHKSIHECKHLSSLTGPAIYHLTSPAMKSSCFVSAARRVSVSSCVVVYNAVDLNNSFFAAYTNAKLTSGLFL